MAVVLALLCPVTFLAMLGVERVFPGRQLPEVRGWLLKGVVCFCLGGASLVIVPALLAPALARHAPLRIDAGGAGPGGVVGFLAADLFWYGVHRVLHNVPLLWRWTHQLHHSAERIDIAG